MPMQVVANDSAPVGRRSSNVRSLSDFGAALGAAKNLTEGRTVVVTVDAKTSEAIGGKNPLNSFAQALRTVFRTEGPHDRIVYTAPESKAVCIRVGTPRPPKKRESKSDKKKK